MERHPEEDNHSKHEAQGHDTLLGLFRSEFHVIASGGLGLFGVDVSVLEPALCREIDRYRDHE